MKRRSLSRKLRSRRQPRTMIEALEPRQLLTVVFNTQFGAETPNSSPPYNEINSPIFHLVLWGTHWGTGGGQFDPAPVIAEAKAILNSTYVAGLSEYGMNGLIGSIDSFVDSAADPPSDFNPGNLGDGHSLGEAQTELTNLVTAASIAGPGSPADLEHAPIYAIITDPTDSSTNGGYNTSGTVSSKNVNIFSVGTDASFGNYGDTFSHETAERITDPDSGGLRLTLPAVVPVAVGSGSDNVQIGDGEAEPGGQSHYTYRIGGPTSQAIVQPFYSVKFSAFIAPDGNTQRFDLAPIWTIGSGNNDTFTGFFNLTINGDQLSNKNDTIVISRDSAGGTKVVLNGETAWFDPNATGFQGTRLKSITINGLSGDDNITIDFSGCSPIPVNGITVNGNGGNNTLTLLNQANTWSITGTNSGSVTGNINFSNIQNLTGGSSSDAFNFSSGAGISGNLNGGAGGTNSLNLSAFTGPVTVNLQNGTAPGVGGTFSNINSVIGSASSNDTLIGPDANWTISGANSGSVNGTTFSSFENLTGGSGGDTFAFIGSGSISENIDGGAGSNSLDYSALSGPVSVNLQTAKASRIGGNFSNIQTFVGSTGSDTLTGPNSSNTWSITAPNTGSVAGESFSSFENLTGGSAADSFAFSGTGSVSGNIDGGAGSNSLDYSALAGPVTVDLQSATATHLGGTFANIDNFVGSASTNDTLIGPDASWIINGTNSGSVNGLTFSSFENLTGNALDDTFAFLPGGSISGDLDGGAGNNTLDYSALTGPITVNLATATAPSIGGTFTNINNLVGSAGSDTLIGPNATATWNLTALNAGSVNGTTFSSFENLTGGSANDTFTFFPTGGVSGNIDGGAGSNTLDYSNLSTPVFINLSNNTATAIGGTWANINAFVGGTGTNTVIGLTASSTYLISGPNQFTVSGFTFIGFNSITGGPGNDTFAFLTGGSLSGNIDGGPGTNTLDYSADAANIIVNLLLHTASGVGGTIANIQNIIGGLGNNMLVGDANNNVLTGGAGRNILIGGAGADTLIGGGSDNILIGDSTIYDTNAAALMAIFNEWTRTDKSFEQRVADLISVGNNGLNGSFTLDKKAILLDNAADILDGSANTLDWFFGDKKLDTETGVSPRDHVTQV